MKGYRLWVIAGLALMTNGAALLGFGQGSVGALARAIEANHSIAHNIERANSQGLLAGNPPIKAEVDFLGRLKWIAWHWACATHWLRQPDHCGEGIYPDGSRSGPRPGKPDYFDTPRCLISGQLRRPSGINPLATGIPWVISS